MTEQHALLVYSIQCTSLSAYCVITFIKIQIQSVRVQMFSDVKAVALINSCYVDGCKAYINMKRACRPVFIIYFYLCLKHKLLSASCQTSWKVEILDFNLSSGQKRISK